VVKELIENAIDAGAKKIEISIEGGGDSFVKIKDDGSGIQPDDLKLAVLPHATSKISTIDDLNHLLTLGFRGEALPSIASVAKLSIVSRLHEEAVGYEIQVEGGKIVSFTETGCPGGTVVTVKELFYNTPARRKFLRSANTEFGMISDMVGRLALAKPEISFSLRHPDNPVLNTSGQGNLLDTIATVLGNETARKMIPLAMNDGGFKLTGYISSSELVRSSRNGETFIVNGRVIHSQLLNQALKDGYHTLIPAGTYPLAVLSLTALPSAYDVNVHPSKLEIKFRNEKELAARVVDSVRRTLLQAKPIRNIGQEPIRNIIKEPMGEFNVNPDVNSVKWEQLKLLYKPLNQKMEFSVAEKQEETAAGGSADVLFPDLRALGQLFNTYILCTDERSLFIIDQHAAHERIRYDDLLIQLREQGVSSQMLLVPETVDLTLQEEQMLLEYFEELHQLGFIIENFGDRTYFLRAVPVTNNLAEQGKLFRKFLDEILIKSFSPTQERLLEKWIYMLACRSAIKGNERLSNQEMEELIQRLGNRPNPFTCPHGRPTIISISKKELDNRFYR